MQGLGRNTTLAGFPPEGPEPAGSGRAGVNPQSEEGHAPGVQRLLPPSTLALELHACVVALNFSRCVNEILEVVVCLGKLRQATWRLLKGATLGFQQPIL